jgi:hypothetical protein
MTDTEHSADSPTDSQGWLTTKRRITIAVAVLVLVAVALMVVNQVIKSKSTENVSVADTFSSVEISTPGKVTITDGPVNITRRSEFVFTKPEAKVKVEDGVLKLSAKCGGMRLGVCVVQYDVALPADVAVKVDNSSGAVVVRASKSDVEVTTKSGDITFENSYGRVKAVTSTGEIKGTTVSSLDVDVESQNGAVDIRFAASPNDVSATSKSGDVRVVVPKSATNYDVEAASQSGRTITEVTREGNSPFKIRAQSESGDVTVEAK